tara:strand:- start:180 stop:410 length:231 start_codon:yes stop_codon:yes gene_type:complete
MKHQVAAILCGPLLAVYQEYEADMKPTVKIEIIKPMTVHLDDRRSINFVPGIHVMSREKADAAIAAGIVKIAPKRR